MIPDPRLRRRGTPSARPRLTCALVGLLLSCALAGCTGGTPEGPVVTSTSAERVADQPGDSADGSPTATSSPAASPEEISAPPLSGLTVAIDPGHNGGNGAHPDTISADVPDGRGGTKACNTVGTSSDDGYPEHRFTWETAQEVQTALSDAGAEVVMSRSSDDSAGPCVDERGRFADAADALVSLHGNGTEDRSARGFHVITAPAGGRAGDDTARTSEALGRALAEALEATGFDRNPAYDDLVVRTDLATLNNAAVPAVMLEAGEMRNAEDAELLESRQGQEHIAEAVVTALTAVFGDAAP